LQAGDESAFSLHRRMRANHRLFHSADALRLTNPPARPPWSGWTLMNVPPALISA